ncbi:MAG TPA: glycosyltransferase N-terminal domain-containing protein [Arenibacter sp.]|nr:glycosyltransferase N-terminal domain-containing protein [Arenibacter sp.]
MFHIYNIAIRISAFFLRLIALFHPKIKLFMEGRKGVFAFLQNNLAKGDRVVWIHTASLGEFEQGLPVIERAREEYPAYKILVTFFSPSGYEVKKNSAVADLITYLPLDTPKNAKRFVELVNPKLVIFVKYEIWPNYLRVLAENKTPVILISAIFKKEQIYFKSYGGFMGKALTGFSHIFVQNANSVNLLRSIGCTNVSLGGDTRFDRVMEILERDNHLKFMEDFRNNSPILVAGSTWPEDEEILVPQINNSPPTLKYVLAPHNIKSEHIRKLRDSIQKKTVLYSEMDQKDLADYEVLIIDTIGLLTKIYSYATIAYVGGGFATGLHNTLEPAVFGIPVIIGPKYKGFKEAGDLVQLGGVLVVTSKLEYSDLIKKLNQEKNYLQGTGAINRSYVSKNKGATLQIMDYIRKVI